MSLLLDAIKHIEARRDLQRPVRVERREPAIERPSESELLSTPEPLVQPPLPVEPPLLVETVCPVPPASSDGLTRAAAMIAARHQDKRSSLVGFCGPEADASRAVERLTCAMASLVSGDVLLVEGCKEPDLQHPPGLVDALNGQCDPLDIVQPTAVNGVYMLGAGIGPLEPVAPQQVGACLRAWTERFRLVVIDLGQLQGPLATYLVPRTATTYVVVSLATTEPRAAAKLVERLRAAGATDIACTAVDETAGG